MYFIDNGKLVKTGSFKNAVDRSEATDDAGRVLI